MICPPPDDGPVVAARLAELDPYGVAAVDTGDGDSVLALAGGNGTEILMQLSTSHAALTAFQRRYRQAKGRHVVMVADASTSSGEGAVYGIFECHQPTPPVTPPPRRRKGKKRKR